MKPAWDQLGDEFASSKTVLIGDVDCTVHKDLCGKYGVRGYPTIKYFTSSTAAFGPAETWNSTDADDLTKLLPQNTYGFHKAVCELMVNDYSRRGLSTRGACAYRSSSCARASRMRP